MAYSINNRLNGYDNIAAGSVKGLELGQLNAEQTVNENNGVGNAQAINKENIITSAGTKAISPAAQGNEIA